MTVFRPCIDLHQGVVKQIVGGTLRDAGGAPTTNFVAVEPAQHFAQLYRRDALPGGHVIKLGPGNDQAAAAALGAWPGGLHVGGGIDAATARHWLELGAQKIIVTSWLFPDGVFALSRLQELERLVGRERVVVDLSCRARRVGTERWFVAMDRWQRVTGFAVNAEHLQLVARHASEFLVHAADVEGLCRGIDQELVAALGQWSPIPCTYAGGGTAMSDLALVEDLSQGRVDLTFGSALDLFGGRGVAYQECVAWNRAHGH